MRKYLIECIQRLYDHCVYLVLKALQMCKSKEKKIFFTKFLYTWPQEQTEHSPDAGALAEFALLSEFVFYCLHKQKVLHKQICVCVYERVSVCIFNES